ncbi:MAG: amidohydrolase family protein [Pseudomonadales bacterium]
MVKCCQGHGDAAWQVFMDDQLGSIEVGKLADLVTLDKDPLQYGEFLKDLIVEKTFIGELEVYSVAP